MVQFKALILMVAVIINLNNCNAVEKRKNPIFINCDEKIIFYNSTEKIILEKNEYNIINNDKTGFHLVILSNITLNKLVKIINPSVEFCIENKKNIAKGNFIYNSSVPSGTKYFFSIDKNNKAVFFKGNILSFKKI